MLSSAILPEICGRLGVLSFGTVIWRSTAAISLLCGSFDAVLSNNRHVNLFFAIFAAVLYDNRIYERFLTVFSQYYGTMYAKIVFFCHLCRSTAWQSHFKSVLPVLPQYWEIFAIIILIFCYFFRSTPWISYFKTFFLVLRQYCKRIVFLNKFRNFCRSTVN